MEGRFRKNLTIDHRVQDHKWVHNGPIAPSINPSQILKFEFKSNLLGHKEMMSPTSLTIHALLYIILIFGGYIYIYSSDNRAPAKRDPMSHGQAAIHVWVHPSVDAAPPLKFIYRIFDH